MQGPPEFISWAWNTKAVQIHALEGFVHGTGTLQIRKSRTCLWSVVYKQTRKL